MSVKMKCITLFTMLIAITASLFSQLPEGEIAFSASSSLTPGKTSDYNPENIYDGTVASWCEGAKGNGIGEYLQVDFRYPDEMIYILIKNGFGKEKYWASNGRIKELRVTNDEGASRILKLEDTPDLQLLGLNILEKNEEQMLEASGGLYGNTFTFEIMEVYPGANWQDVCIAEMNFNQLNMKSFPLPVEYRVRELYRIFFGGVYDQSGKLFVEKDWDGFVETATNDGYIYNEIASGDATLGFDEYQVFIQAMTDRYYLFHSKFRSSISEAGMEGKTGEDGKPERVQKASWEFYHFDQENQKFNLLDEKALKELFIVLPTTLFYDEDGNSISNEDISMSCITPMLIRITYPPYSENQIDYVWDGNLFRIVE